MFPEWLKIQTDSVQFFWVMWSHWNTLLRAKPLCTHLALPMKSSIWGHSTYKLKHIPGDSGFCLQTYCSERLWCFGCVVLSERAEILDVFRLQRRRQTLDGVDDVMLAPIRHHQQLIPAQQTTSYFDYYHFLFMLQVLKNIVVFLLTDVCYFLYFTRFQFKVDTRRNIRLIQSTVALRCRVKIYDDCTVHSFTSVPGID